MRAVCPVRQGNTSTHVLIDRRADDVARAGAGPAGRPRNLAQPGSRRGVWPSNRSPSGRPGVVSTTSLGLDSARPPFGTPAPRLSQGRCGPLRGEPAARRPWGRIVVARAGHGSEFVAVDRSECSQGPIAGAGRCESGFGRRAPREEATVGAHRWPSDDQRGADDATRRARSRRSGKQPGRGPRGSRGDPSSYIR